MDELNFNIRAFIAPTNRTEFIALLDEALRMADELDAMISRDQLILESICVPAAQ